MRSYDPDGLRVMITGIDRYLVEDRWKLSMMRDREFSASKQFFEGKARLLRQQSKIGGRESEPLENSFSNQC